MGIVVIPSFGADPVSVTGPTLDAKVDGLGTEFNGNIENANIKAGAAIANSKLNLASIAQDVTLAGTTTISGASTISGVQTFSSKIQKLAKGADVASAAGAMTLGDDGNYFDITGTEAITSITAKTAGTVVTLQFDSTATLTDGSNLKLDGNFTGAAGSTITLVSDGTNWFEKCRSPQFSPTSANAITGSVVQVVNVQTGAMATGTTVIPIDDSIPAITEGDEYMTLAITPKSATNKLKIDVVFVCSDSAGNYPTVALFQDATSAALAAVSNAPSATATIESVINFTHFMTAGTTSATTFRVRSGPHSASTITFNGQSGARIFGGVMASSITISEIKA
jgi:hypothetical protein